MLRRLIIQLARLGDLVQSYPVLTSLHHSHLTQPLDLLCPLPLVPLGEMFPGLGRVFPWNGEDWHELAKTKSANCEYPVEEAKKYLSKSEFPAYSLAYNLNNHPRGILAGHLLSQHVVGPGENGPMNPTLPPWAVYLREVARARGDNRIHLADAFCGLCHVAPPSDVPWLIPPDISLPVDLEGLVTQQSFLNIGIILGAGDADRRIPLAVWQEFIQSCTERIPHSRVLLIGGSGEREASLVLEHNLAAQTRNQVINCCGRTSLPQLAAIFNHCQWVVGSDTGPLHLGVMCGARAIGWYFSQARVHETGPYGVGNYVWQHQSHLSQDHAGAYESMPERSLPHHWPVVPTLDLMQEEPRESIQEEWALWTSHRDDWGVFYTQGGDPDPEVFQRREIWERLSQPSSLNTILSSSPEMITG